MNGHSFARPDARLGDSDARRDGIPENVGESPQLHLRQLFSQTTTKPDGRWVLVRVLLR